MPKNKRYCPDCGSLMDIRGECECHHPRAICPLFHGLARTLENHFILCARQDGAVIQAREFASMPERNEFYRCKCCANPLDCRVVRLSDHVPEGTPLPDTELAEKLMQLCMQETEDI